MFDQHSRYVGLEYLTFVGMPPVEFIEVAASAGFDGVGLRVSPADEQDHPFDLRVGGAGLREARRALAQTGLKVLDVEVLSLDSTTRREDYMWILEAAAELGARYLNVTGNDADLSRFTEMLSRLTADAKPFDLVPAVEPMAWKALNSLASAVSCVGAAGGAVLQVDALHLNRLGADPSDLAGLDPNLLSYLQLCDAPAAPLDNDPLALQAEGRHDRLLPGHGALPLNRLLEVMPTDSPVGVEVPSAASRGVVTPVDYARKAHQATMSLLQHELVRDPDQTRRHTS